MSIKHIPIAAGTALAILCGGAAAAELDATLVPAGIERAGRGVYDLIFDVNLANNSGQPQQHLSAELQSTAPATEIIDGALNLPALDAGASAEGADQIRVRQAYRTRFRPGNLQLTVTGEAPVAGQYRLKSGRAAFIERMAVEEAILRHGIAAVVDQLPEIKQRLDQRAVDLGTTLDADEHRELLLRLLQFLPGQLAFERTDGTHAELRTELQALRDQKLTEDLSGDPLPPPVVGAEVGWARSFDEIAYAEDAASIAWTGVEARAPELRAAVMAQVDADLAGMETLSIANARPMFLGSSAAIRGHLQLVDLHAATLGLDDDIGPYDSNRLDLADDAEALRYLLHIRLADYHRNAGHLGDAEWVAHCERGGSGFSLLRAAPNDPHYHHDGLCHGALLAMNFPVELPDRVVTLPDYDPDNPALTVTDSGAVPTNQAPALRTLYASVADGSLTELKLGEAPPHYVPGNPHDFQQLKVQDTTWLVQSGGPPTVSPGAVALRVIAEADGTPVLVSYLDDAPLYSQVGNPFPASPDSRSYTIATTAVNLDSDFSEEVIVATNDHLCLIDVIDDDKLESLGIHACTQLPADEIPTDHVFMQVSAISNYDVDGSATVIVAKSVGNSVEDFPCQRLSPTQYRVDRYRVSMANGFEHDTAWGLDNSGQLSGDGYLVLVKARSANPMAHDYPNKIWAMEVADYEKENCYAFTLTYDPDTEQFHQDGLGIFNLDTFGYMNSHIEDYLNSTKQVWNETAYVGNYASAYLAAGPAKTYHFAGQVLAMLDPPPCRVTQFCTSDLTVSSSETTSQSYSTGHAFTQSWSVEVKASVGGPGAGVIAGVGHEETTEVKKTTTDTSQTGTVVATGMTVKSGSGQWWWDHLRPMVKAQTLIRTVQPFTVLASVSRPDYNGQTVNLVTQRNIVTADGPLNGFDNADQLQAIYDEFIGHEPGTPESYRDAPPVLGGSGSDYDPDANSLFLTSATGDYIVQDPDDDPNSTVNTSVTTSTGTSHTDSKTQTQSNSVTVLIGAYVGFMNNKAEVTQKWTNKWSHIQGSAYSTAFSDAFKGSTAINVNTSYAAEHNMASRVIVGTAFARHADSDQCIQAPKSPSDSDTLTACPSTAMLVVTNQLIPPDGAD